ncbi:heterokaryon incompatibility protein-domain-containing protein [Collybia nuda]|uniref:Heterokaryon incompatibility protein-domain-containing protein n=1 Tax=Collybia nuda TaxID=64659 RepID=A0A9P6CHL8_9AGAR|nr:heterokaryon incompatibility protein-domain-containing protein [Collybia nuda]
MSPVKQNNATAKPNVVCEICRGLINTIKDDIGGKTTRFPISPNPIAQYTIPKVQLSGLGGCHICSIISQCLCPAHSKRDILATSDSYITVKIMHSGSGPIKQGSINSDRAFLDVVLKNAKGKRITGSTLAIVPSSSPLPNRHVAASWSVSTGSDATFDLAQQWLEQCISDHELCEEIRITPASSNRSAFPTYLVEVDQEGARLRRSEDLPDRPKYLTLSHRWGGSRIFTLTSKNLSELLTKIPLYDLPKTFQDAVLVIRRLGYRYIWIDSLCIIQDSREHWETESAIMGDIYRGSTCTIAVLGATDGDSGFFKTRNPLCFQYYTFQLDSGEIFHLEPGNLKKSLGLTGYGSLVEPLHERAWVMQERMLSPRTLFYGTFGLYWECVLKDADVGNPQMTNYTGTKYAVHEACTLSVTGQFDQSYKVFWRMWTRVISMYNSCGLTYGTDKLVAIAGIVNLVESKTRLHSLAGLWKEYIFPELLWFVEKPTTRPKDVYQAPTWSWASLNSEVGVGIQDFDYTFNWKIELLEAVTKPAAANGQLLSAHIRVRAPLMLVRWEAVENGHKLRWGKSIPTENSADDRVYFLPDIEPDPNKEFWALQVVHATSHNSWMNMGLVIAKMGTGDSVWVRVGSFRQYDWPTSSTEFFTDGNAEMRELVIV